MPYHITLSQLEYFCTVVTAKTTHEAAKKLHIAQPSLSVALKNLEKEVGLPLFDRRNRHLSLTQEGKLFYKEARLLLSHATEVNERIALIKKGKQRIKLGIAPMMGMFLFPLIYKNFAPLHPEVEFEIHEFGTLKLQQMLKVHELDLAFLIDTGTLEKSFIFKPLIKTNYHLYVGKEDPLCQLQASNPSHKISFEDYKQAPMIFYRETSYIQSQITRHFQMHKVVPNILLRTNQIHTIKQLARQSLGVAYLTEKAVSPEDELELIHTDYSFGVTIGLAQNIESNATQAILDFMNYMESVKNTI